LHFDRDIDDAFVTLFNTEFSLVQLVSKQDFNCSSEAANKELSTREPHVRQSRANYAVNKDISPNERSNKTVRTDTLHDNAETGKPDFALKSRHEDRSDIVPECTKSFGCFFSNWQVYTTYRFFFLLLERLEFVYKTSMSNYESEYMYHLFIDLLICQLFGLISNQNFELAMIMMFDKHCGVLLNIDKIFQSFFKSIPADDVFSGVVDASADSENESVVFARTCHRMNEMTARESKSPKSQSCGGGANELCNDVFKFHFHAGAKVLLVHVFESPFVVARKEIINSQHKYRDVHDHVIAKPVSIVHRRKQRRGRSRVCQYGRRYAIVPNQSKLLFINAQCEDNILGVNVAALADDRVKKIAKLNKIARFRSRIDAKSQF
jgi:hypothetical protein